MISIPPIEEIISEMGVAIGKIVDQSEGFLDYQGTKLIDPTQHLPPLKMQEERYNHRRQLYEGVIEAARILKERILAVLDDGYPEIPLLPVDEATLADLDDQLRTMTAARKTFVARSPAVKANVSFSAPRKKVMSEMKP